jgi:Zn-dependent peptidase ImmA (M78 family)
MYESGAKVPSAATLASLSLALSFPVEFFARDGRRVSGIDQGKAWYRSLRSTKQLDRDRAEAHAFLVSEIAETMQRHVRMPNVDIPEDLHVSESADRETIERRAVQLRRRWNIPDGPIANMVRLLEAHGVIVTRGQMGCEQVSAFSRWFRKGPVVVLQADQLNMDRVRFDAAHELGHLLLHAEAEPANRILERQADRFAASFLLPAHLIYDHLPTRLNWDKFGTLKQTWGVSVAALLYRAKELGRITEATYRRAVMVLAKRGERKNEWEFPLKGVERITLFPRAMDIMASKGYTVTTLAKEARLPSSIVGDVIAVPDDELPGVHIEPNEESESVLL